MKVGFINIEADDAIVRKVAREIEENDVIRRIWAKDHTVWKDRDEEIGNRLGWLGAPDKAAVSWPAWKAFARSLGDAGFRQVLLLGMGGSSLAPQVLARVFGPGAEGLPLDVLDSTDPAAVIRLARSLDFASTLFLVSSKSGTTLETTSLLNYFFVRTADAGGRENAGAKFVAITDPGSWLEGEARRLNFRAVFHGDPMIGGRFSVFSAFGLVPAALLGLDGKRLLSSAREEMAVCRNGRIEDNPAARLGVLLGALALAGRDKAVFLLPPRLNVFGEWLEQLLAESTGKEGRGILPLVRAAGASLDQPADDKVFVSLVLGEDAGVSGRAAALVSGGAPLISIRLGSPDDLAGHFYFWEFATAVAGAVLDINPFDQPQVALSKKKTEAAIRRFKDREGWPEDSPVAREDGLAFFAEEETSSLEIGLARFFDTLRARDYLVLQAFLPPFSEVEAALKLLAGKIGDRTNRPVTFDFGPRFLHATGQLHKGDAGRGLFLQLTASHAEDTPVPDSADGPSASVTFGELIDAQAFGDREALREKGRRLARVHIEGNVVAGLARLAERVR